MPKFHVFATYSGPSYGTLDPFDAMEAFTSIAAAREQYTARQETSGTWGLPVNRVTFSADHSEWTVEDTEHVQFPATTTQDMMELYSPGSAEPFARFVAGPRGGAVREDY